MFRRARSRLRLGLLVLASLLFQQVAVAAYACELSASPQPAAPAPTVLAHCAEMGMAPVLVQSPALCDEHCDPDRSVLSDLVTLQVPALVPPLSFGLVLRAPGLESARRSDVTAVRFDPPPRLRYCSLLI